LQAVTLFGAPQIRSIVLASSIQRGFDIDLSPYNITTAEFSKISTIQSELIFQWYMGIDIDMARTLTPIAFLMETGKILIAKEILEEKKIDEFLEDLNKYEDESYVENIYTMMSSAQINALMFKHFNLNDSFSESMKYLDNQQKIPEHMKKMVEALQIVRAAINVRYQLSEHSIKHAIELLEKNSYDVEAFLRAIKRIKKRYLE
jgi:HD-like signal output (HDOD) protein